MILSFALAVMLALGKASPAGPPPDVDSVFGFQELQLESPPIDSVETVADPSTVSAFVDHAYVEDVQFGKRRLRVYVTLFRGDIESIELQPADSDDLDDLLADLTRMYGRPTRHTALETLWEGRKARLTWTHLYGATIITLTSRRLEREMKAYHP